MAEKMVISIMDMHCANCVLRLECLEEELPGLLRVEASYHSQRMAVEYDPELIDLDRILDAVREKGYHPTSW